MSCPRPALLLVLLAGCGGGSGGSSGGSPPPPDGTAPAAPSSLTATAASATSAELQWQDNSTDETGFALERMTLPAGAWAQVATLPASTTARLEQALAASTSYAWRVRATNATGPSAWSATAEATTPSAPPPPTDAWAKSYAIAGGGQVFAAAALAGGGFIVAGSVDVDPGAVTNEDAWVARLGADGSVVWQRRYGGASQDQARAIRPTADGGFIVAGGTRSFSASGDAWVLKLASDGAVVWQKRYGAPGPTEWAYDVVQTDDDADGVRDDGYAVAAVVTPSSDRAWVLKLDPDGAVTWERLPDTTAAIGEANALRQLAGGGYAVAGERTVVGSGRSDTAVFLLAANGATTAVRTYAAPDRSRAYALEQTDDDGDGVADDGLVVAGSADLDPTGVIREDACVLKLAADGAITWQKSVGDGSGVNPQTAYDVKQRPDGGFVVGGTTQGFGGSSNEFFAFELDATGALGAQRRLGGLGGETAYAVAPTADGGILLAGGTTSTAFTGGVFSVPWVVKLPASLAIDLDPLQNASVADTTGAASDATASLTDVTLSVTTETYGVSAGVDTTATAIDTAAAVRTQSR
jgi:fibronectin type III domain protein